MPRRGRRRRARRSWHPAVSPCTSAPEWMSARWRLCELDPARDGGEALVVEGGEVPLDAEVAEHARCRRGGRARPDAPVECTGGLVRWAPISSGGTSRPVYRWICRRSRGSRVSLVQMRSVCSRMPRSTRAPPDAHDSISSPGWRRLQRREQPVQGVDVVVHAGARPVSAAPASSRSRLWSHLR